MKRHDEQQSGDFEQDSSAHDTHRQQSVAGAVIGAVLIQPVAFALAWLKGLILGASVPMAPTPVDRHGFDGALTGIEELFFLYIATVGLIPLLITLVGGGLGFALGGRIGKKTTRVDSSTVPPVTPSSPVKLLAFWASALLIGQFCIQFVAFQFSNTLYWNNVTIILFGLHWSIWLVGAIVACVKHQDLRIPAGLIGIGVLLAIVGPWLPRILLPATAIGVLLYCFTQRAGRQQNQSNEQPAPQADEMELNGFALFSLGGVSFYTLVCLYCLCWAMSLPPGSENWGPGMLLILGAWGIPVFGGIAPLMRRSMGRWPWLTTRVLWIAVACEVIVCGLAWIGVVFHG